MQRRDAVQKKQKKGARLREARPVQMYASKRLMSSRE